MDGALPDRRLRRRTLLGAGVALLATGCDVGARPGTGSTPSAPATSAAPGGPVTMRPPSQSPTPTSAPSAPASTAASPASPANHPSDSPSAARTGSPTKSTWTALSHQLDGRLYRPGEAGYESAIQTFDPRRDGLRPVAVVRAAGSHDVAAALAFAVRHGISPRPRSGGHSYVGASTGNDVLVIDVGGLDTIDYRSTSVTVGPGARLGNVHSLLDQHGRTIPTGTCPTVGAAGLTLGGGIGTESRLYGLAADALAAAELVTPDGRIHQTSATREPDLFWALRGGGGGNFGVITQLRYATSPAQPGEIFRLAWDPADSQRVLLGWQRRLAVMPRHSWANLHLDSSGGSVTPSITGICWNTSADAEINALTDAIGHQPATRTVLSESHSGAMDWFAGGTNGYTRQSWYAGSDVVGPAISSSTAAAVIKAVGNWHGAGSVSAIFDPLGAAVGDVATNAAAFPWRTARCSIQWYVGLGNTGKANLRQAADWVSAAHKAIGTTSVGGYINYLEPSRKLSAYYGNNWNRLVALAKKYDPQHVLNSRYSLPG